MYAFCFFGVNSHFEEMCTRLLPEDAQYHDNNSSSVSSYENRRRRSRKRDLSSGFDQIALALQFQNSQLALQTEKAELKRVKIMVTDAEAQSTKSILSALKDAQEMHSLASGQDKPIFQKVIRKLINDLSTSD